MTALPLRDFTAAEQPAGIPLLVAATWPPRVTHAIARLLGWTAALKEFCPCGTCGEGR